MMSYKDALYQSYHSTHISGRKGDESQATLEKRGKTYDSQLGKLFPQNKNAAIADLGCGSGSVVRWLASRGYRDVVGVDISGEQVGQSARLGIKGIIQADLLEFLETTEQQYDVLIARDVLEHFEKENVFRFARACARRLRPSGQLILQVPNAESPFAGRIRYGDFTHELAFTPSSIRQIMLAAGFTKVTVYPARPVATGFRSTWRAAIWRVLEVFLKALIRIESPQGGEVVTLNLIAVAHRGDDSQIAIS